MSTTRTTVTTDVRSWLDFDPKFLAPLVVLLVSFVTEVFLVARGQVTLLEAGTVVGPLFLAALGAYAATSTHREVIEGAGRHAAQAVRLVAPVVAAEVPQAAPVVGGVEAMLAALDEQQPVLSESATIPLPTAP